MDSFLDKPSRDMPSDRLDNWMLLRCCGIPNVCDEPCGPGLGPSGPRSGRSVSYRSSWRSERSRWHAAWSAGPKKQWLDYASPEQGTKKSAPMLRSGRKKNEPGTMPGSFGMLSPPGHSSSGVPAPKAREAASPQGGEGQGWASGFDIANHRPDGKTPTKTIGSLQGRGRSTVAVT